MFCKFAFVEFRTSRQSIETRKRKKKEERKRERERKTEKEKFLSAWVSRSPLPHVVPYVLCLWRYPVKTLTWVTRCSGSAHRSGGSPEAFIVLQVYYGRPGIGRPRRRPIRLLPRMTTAFSVKTFRAVAHDATPWETFVSDWTYQAGKIGKSRSMRAIDMTIDTAI